MGVAISPYFWLGIYLTSLVALDKNVTFLVRKRRRYNRTNGEILNYYNVGAPFMKVCMVSKIKKKYMIMV